MKIKDYITVLINDYLQHTSCMQAMLNKCLEMYQTRFIIVIIEDGKCCQVENPAPGFVHIRIGVDYINKICELCAERFGKKPDDVLMDINLENVSPGCFKIENHLQQNSEIKLPHPESETAAYFVYALAFAIYHEMGHMYMQNIGTPSCDNEIKSDVFAVCLIKESTLDIEKAIEGCMLDLNCVSILQQNVIDDEHPTIEKRQTIVSLLQDNIENDIDLVKMYAEIQKELHQLATNE